MRSASVPSAPRRCRVALLLAAALALAGCARDLELPGVPSSPTLAGFTPSAAHAGELLRVSASHLEADASANTVNFAHASARGERWLGGELVVRVPADAGDGAITVSNREGTSAASGAAFGYLGLGEPRRIQVASANPILHRPLGVYAVGGDVVMHSSLYVGLAWAGNSTFTTPALTTADGFPSPSAADPWQGPGGALYYATFEPAKTAFTITRVDAATGVATHSADLPGGFVPVQLVPMDWLGLLAVLGNEDGAERLGAYQLSDLTEQYAPADYGIDTWSFFGAADVGDGRLVIADYDGVEGLTLALVDVGGALPGAAGSAQVLAAPAAAGLTTASSGLTPLAVGRAMSAAPGVMAGDHLAAVALDDGNVAVADLDGGAPAFLHFIETWSAAEVESIAAAPADGPLGGATGVAVATKTGDGLSLGIDLATGEVRWSVEGNAPKVASVDGPIAFIAHDGDNDVTVVNLATGGRIGRVNLDVRPGVSRFGFDAVAGFVPTDAVDGDLLFPSSAFPGLLRFSTSTGEPALVSRGPAFDFVNADLASGDAWATTSDARVGIWSAGDWSTEASVSLPGVAVARTASQGTSLAVAHDGGLSLLDGSTAVGTVAIPGTTSPWFHALGFTATDDVWLVVDLDSGLGSQVQRWPAAALAAGGAPTTWTVPGTDGPSPTVTVQTAARLEDGLWVFWEGPSGSFGTLLDESLSPVRTVATNADLRDIQAISPNGRLLVQREAGATLGYVIRFFRADPDAGFPTEQVLVFPENVTGFAFDAAGERLYVLTQGPDRVVTID